MVDRTENMKALKDVKYYGWAVYEVTVSLNDTITLGDFVSTEVLKFAALIRQDTGAEITCTYITGDNVVKVTGASADNECILFAFGRRA